MLPVPGPDLGHPRRRVEVVVAVGHPEPALQEERRVAGRLVQVLRDPEAEEVVGVEVGALNASTSARSVAPSARARPRASRDRGDPLEVGLQRRQALGLDGRLVQERRVGVADLPRLGAGGGVRLRRLGDQLGGPLRRQLGQDAAQRPRSCGRPGSRRSSSSSRSPRRRSRPRGRRSGRCRRGRCGGGEGPRAPSRKPSARHGERARTTCREGPRGGEAGGRIGASCPRR